MKFLYAILLYSLASGEIMAQATFKQIMRNIPKDESFQNRSKTFFPEPYPLPPRAVKIVTASRKDVTISWRPPFLSRSIKGYKIYRNFKLLKSLTEDAREYRDSTVQPGKEYYYMIRTINGKGRESGVVGLFAYNGYQSSNGVKGWEKIIKLPYVSGITVSFFWGDVEPEKGKFNWKHIDDLIELAAKHNKTIGLWPYMPSPWCPKWLNGKVVKYDMDQRRCKSNIPYPLDPIIKKEWIRFITELGKRYNKNPNISYVLVGLSGTSGMHNNVQPEPRQFELLAKKFNYKVEDHINAWKDMFKLYAKVFPDKQWGCNIQYTNDEVGPALVVADWALKNFGSQVRVMNEGLNGCPWYRLQWKLNGWKLNNEYIADQSWRTMSGYQMLGRSWNTTGLDKGTNGAMKDALENGVEYGANWIEVWTQDIIQKAYIPYFEEFAGKMGLVKVTIPEK